MFSHFFPDLEGRKLWRKGNTSKALNKNETSLKHCGMLKNTGRKRERKGSTRSQKIPRRIVKGGKASRHLGDGLGDA